MSPKEEIIKVLVKNKSKDFTFKGDLFEYLGLDDFDTVANQILSALQPNSEIVPPLQQADVSGLLEKWLQKQIALKKIEQGDAVEVELKAKAGIKMRAYKECLDYILSHRSQ